MRHPKRLENAIMAVLSCFLASPIVAFADNPLHFKQPAGPPTEFGEMAPPEPILTAIRSKSALLPVTLGESDNGQWTWRSEVPFEVDDLRIAVIPGPRGSWNVEFQESSNGRILSPEALGARRRTTGIGFSNIGLPADVYEFKNLAYGDLWISIESNEPGHGFILIDDAGPARLSSHLAVFNQRVGQHIGVVAQIFDREDGVYALGAGSVSEATLRVITPDNQVLTSTMLDDGSHNDGQPADGVFGANFLADHEGNFIAQVIVKGQNQDGSKFVRTAEHLIPVVRDSMTFDDRAASSGLVSDHRLEIEINVYAPQATGRFRVFSEVWGSDSTNSEVSIPVAWIGGMTNLRDGALKLGLDTRWIEISGAQGPFELRNVRIEDPNHFITLATTDRLQLTVPALPSTGVPPDQIVVDEEMVMGPRPAGLDAAEASGVQVNKQYTDGFGHRLLLVHGYCSSDVWGTVADQFTDASIFLDLNQNRGLDDFATRIFDWAVPWNSYSIVAHSQGGMAALHLYSTYWSGLDNAGPGRLLQSVGTPYQGTNLAGILATLGSWFGVSCGSNDSLTYSGAAAWLAGIPTANRAEVHYYTTSFTDGLGYDYCNAATDLLLNDPEDGVVEHANAQLPGGINQGHQTGQCHSDGMRDPAQYRDSSRNAIMNANAAIGPPPGSFLLANPTNGYPFNSETSTVTLSWTSSSNATSYDVYFGTNSSPPHLANQAETSRVVLVNPGETYYWNVQAQNQYGSTWSTGGTWDFSVEGNAPVSFSLVDPTNGYPFDSETSTVTLSWTSSSNATSYDVFFGTSSNPPHLANQGETFRLVPVSPGQTYYWNIQAQNQYGSTWSSGGVWTFSVGGSAPGPFSLLNPPNGHQFDSETANVTLSWTLSSDATSYDVYFGPSPTPPHLANQSDTTRVIQVIPGESYFWNIQAQNLYGSTWCSSGTWTFSIDPEGTDLPNLTPFSPDGWSDNIVVSNTTGTTVDSSLLGSSENLYVDWAIMNSGLAESPAVTPYTSLYLDGELFDMWPSHDPIAAGSYISAEDVPLGPLSDGIHSLRIEADIYDYVSETNENDNTYTRTFSVGGLFSDGFEPGNTSAWSSSVSVPYRTLDNR